TTVNADGRARCVLPQRRPEDPAIRSEPRACRPRSPRCRPRSPCRRGSRVEADVWEPMLIRTSLAGITALTIAACSSSDVGRSPAKVSEIEWTTTSSSGQTVQGRADIGYEGSHVKDVSFKLAGAA